VRQRRHPTAETYYRAKTPLKPLITLRKADQKASIIFRAVFILVCISLILCFCFMPFQTTLKTTALIAWASVLISMLRLGACFTPKPECKQSYKVKETPIYTVLVPLFHEANMVESLMKNLEAFHYPQEKLEILLICETVDPETIAAVKHHLRPPFQLIIVPKGTPQTKPRALNYAFQFSRGEFITIYDAEDQPHPDQLIAALKAFEENDDWCAVQAPLDYFNIKDSWLAKQFALEYAALFHVWLPFLGCS